MTRIFLNGGAVEHVDTHDTMEQVAGAFYAARNRAYPTYAYIVGTNGITYAINPDAVSVVMSVTQ